MNTTGFHIDESSGHILVAQNGIQPLILTGLFPFLNFSVKIKETIIITWIKLGKFVNMALSALADRLFVILG